jgi:hypothetical protein
MTWTNRSISLVLIVAILNMCLVSSAAAAGAPFTPEEASALADQQTASPELAEFQGGGAGEVILVLAVIGIIVYLVWQHASTTSSIT